MLRTRHLPDALRAAALWLLVVSVFFGPVGLGGSVAFAGAWETCGVSCPCDDAVDDDHADDHDEGTGADRCGDDAAAESAGHGDGKPCKDDCPNDCPNCGCCLGVAMAVVPPLVNSSAVLCGAARTLAPVDAPASGGGSGIFRPPRSLL